MFIIATGIRKKIMKDGETMAAEVIAFANNKGGVLKTTSCVNLAGFMSSNGARVLIIDTDPQGHVALSFGFNPRELDKTLFDVLTNDIDVTEAILKATETIDILPVNRSMTQFESITLIERRKYLQPYLLLKQKIEPILDQYDYIFIDSPPEASVIMGNVLAAANGVIIPFQPEEYVVEGLLETLAAIKDIRAVFNPDLKIIGILPTLIDKRTNIHKEVIDAMQPVCAKHGGAFFETFIPRSIEYPNAIAYHHQPATLTKNRKINKTFKSLAKEIETRKELIND